MSRREQTIIYFGPVAILLSILKWSGVMTVSSSTSTPIIIIIEETDDVGGGGGA